MITISDNTVKVLRHILAARIDNADDHMTYVERCDFRDIVEYALADNYDVLKEFDYLPTEEDEKEAMCQCEKMGCPYHYQGEEDSYPCCHYDDNTLPAPCEYDTEIEEEFE